MKRAIPWIIACLAAIAFVASFSELQRVRGRFREVTRHQFHDHKDMREFMIMTVLDGLDHPIVVLGDSITEMARFPESFEGHPLVNAGIGGASIGDFIALAPKLLNDVTPTAIVVALETNDIGSQHFREDYASLLGTLKKRCPEVIAVEMSPFEEQIATVANSKGARLVRTHLRKESMLADGIHLNAGGSRQWTAAILAALIDERVR